MTTLPSFESIAWTKKTKLLCEIAWLTFCKQVVQLVPTMSLALPMLLGSTMVFLIEHKPNIRFSSHIFVFIDPLSSYSNIVPNYDHKRYVLSICTFYLAIIACYNCEEQKTNRSKGILPIKS
jgi:hypothetical protein